MCIAEENLPYSLRSNTIDYSTVPTLHYLGNYVRKLPVSMERMMENAYDWEHLPFVHQSSFSSIASIETGSWGWRARVGLPPSGSDNFQIIELLVDVTKSYWATTVLAGQGEGIQIHTQANRLSSDSIEIDVRFYLPQAPAEPAQSDLILNYLRTQYGQLYDEDLGLMEGRQFALDQKHKRSSTSASREEILIGRVADMNPDQSYMIELATGSFAVRYWQGRWITHSAICPHRLGPLGMAPIGSDGTITCPWHGFRFNIESGKNDGAKCASLEAAPNLVERDGYIYLLPLSI